jgi:tetratricopeptide (TPR) repeat protein
MNKHWLAGLAILLTVVGGLAIVWRLQERIDAERRAIHEERDEMVLRSPNLIRNLSLEYAPLMGAIYWTRAVQYYGEKHHVLDPKLELLWPLLDVATTLDPKLLVAYRFGSTFLSDAPPRGAGRPDLAVRLLQRGLKAYPNEWHLYQDLGNVYYFDAKDYPKAAQAFEEGSKNPNALIWMKIMAAKIAAEGETPETSYALWMQVLQTTTDPAIKKNAESHLRVLKADLDIRELNRLADEYQKKVGHRPARISDLVQAGFLRGAPTDADGYPYVLDEDGQADLNLNSPLLEEKLLNKSKN